MRLAAPAVIHLVGPALAQVRPAAFTWRTATGIAWLEPGYLVPDPMGPAPAFHLFRGEVREMDLGLVVDGEAGTALAFDQAAVAEDANLCPPELLPVFAGFARALEELGVTWGEELARMTEALAADLELAGGLAG